MFGAALATLAVVYVYLQLVRSVEPLGLDQGLFACFGRWVPDGRLPYRDIWDTKPPLFLYTWVLAWSFGGTAQGAWWFEAAWVAVTMGVTFTIAARAFGRWAGLAAAALLFVGLNSPGFGGYWARAQAEELLALPMLAAAACAFAAIDRPRAALWAGVLTAIVGLYKVPGMALAGAWVALWIVHLPIAVAARRVAWFAAGLVAPWAATALWFAAHGALTPFVEAVFIAQRNYAQLISPPWGIVFQEFTRGLTGELGALLIAAVTGLAILWRRDRPRAVWLSSWLAAMLAAVLVQRQLAGYHYLLVVPPLALAGAYGIVASCQALVRGGTRVRALGAAALLVVLVAGVRQAGAWQREYGPDASHRRGKLSRRLYLARFERGVFSPAVEEEASRYLRARTTPDDSILVWGLSPGIYALADRRPATRFPFHKLMLTDAPLSRMLPGLARRRADFMRGLTDAPPAYILVGTDDANPFEPQGSVAGLAQFEELAAFVADGYQQEHKIGHFVVLRRAH